VSPASQNSFNAVRLFAALQVAFIHATWHLDVGFNPVGWAPQFPGVPMFFAISGCLVLDSLLRLQSTSNFFLHRASRIYPALIVNIAILEAALYLAHQVDFSGQSIKACIKYFFVYDLTASIGFASRLGGYCGAHSFSGLFQYYPSGVLWTLTVELNFYLIMPLFLWFRSRLVQTALIAAASILSLALQKHLGEGISSLENFPNNSIIPYFWMFGIGMLFRLWLPPSWSNKFAIPIIIVLIVLASLVRGPIWYEYRIDPSPLSIAQTFLVCLLAVWLGSSPFLKSKLLAKTDMSYGAYLYHMLLVTPLERIPHDDRAWWLIPLVLVGAMVAGAMSWHLVEWPIMKLVRKRNRSEVRTVRPSHA
jgi:peptidoglycan/LPS O-acetylase OafA/YrhL